MEGLGDGMSFVRRGEVYYANLNPVTGSEQGGIRPVLIVQNDMGNAHSTTVSIAPFTSKRKHKLPTHVNVGTLKWLRKGSIVEAEQAMTIDETRIEGRCIGKIPEDMMKRVDQALRIHFSL